MKWGSTRRRRRGIIQFVSVTIVCLIGFICTVSASGGLLSSIRASVPERMASAGDISLSRNRVQTFPDATKTDCPDPVAGDKLGPGTADSDLVVSDGTCIVNAG